MNVAIIGTGAYGMALASVFYNNKCKIKMWTNSEEEKNILLKNGKSDKVDFVIHKDIVISTDMKVVVDSAELIIIAIPAKFLDSTSKELKKYYNNKQVICIASKGIEQNTCRFLYDVVRENINTNNIAIISGGTFAVDIVYKVPIGLTLATRSNTARDVLLKYMQNDYVKLRHTRDIVGTEICGAIKNVIAIGYRELYNYLDGNCTKEEAIEKIKQNSRHYAKRQYTFFNHQLPVVWFETDYNNFNNTIEKVASYIDSN
jgi:glycerol-3-phosphate dehydrogenase (NAD(P)+)